MRAELGEHGAAISGSAGDVENPFTLNGLDRLDHPREKHGSKRVAAFARGLDAPDDEVLVAIGERLSCGFRQKAARAANSGMAAKTGR